MILSHDAIQINNHLMSYNNSLIADHANIKPELDYYYAIYKTQFEPHTDYTYLAKNDAGFYNDWASAIRWVEPTGGSTSVSYKVNCMFDNAVNIDCAFMNDENHNSRFSGCECSGDEQTCFANVTAANSAFNETFMLSGSFDNLFEKSNGFYSLVEANDMFNHVNIDYATIITIPDNSFNKLKQADNLFCIYGGHTLNIVGNSFNKLDHIPSNFFGYNAIINIGDNCFNNVRELNTDSFGISNNFSAIGDNCFNSISSITESILKYNQAGQINIGNSFKNLKIGENAFSQNSHLRYFDLYNLNKLENGKSAFMNDDGYRGDIGNIVENDYLPNLKDADYMFYHCTNLHGDISAFIQTHSATITSHKCMFQECISLDRYYDVRDLPEYSAWFV